MTKYIGRLLNLGVAKEASRGVGVAPTYLLPWVSMSFDDKVVKVNSQDALGSLADSDDSFVTTKYGAGDIEGEIRDKSFGLFLYNLLGTCVTSGPTDSTYSHAFSLAETNTHQSLCLTASDANTKEMYPLVMLDSLEISAELDKVITFSASFMSKKGNTSTVAMPAAIAENKFTKKHLSFKVAANLAGIAAATAVTVKSLKLKISNNVVLDDGIGTAEPEDINNKQISIEGTVTLNYTDETFKNYMRNNDSKAVEIKLVNTDVYAAGTTRPSLTIQLPKVDFFEWSPEYKLDDITTQTFSFKAHKDISGGNAIISTCTLVNAVTSY